MKDTMEKHYGNGNGEKPRDNGFYVIDRNTNRCIEFADENKAGIFASNLGSISGHTVAIERHTCRSCYRKLETETDREIGKCSGCCESESVRQAETEAGYR